MGVAKSVTLRGGGPTLSVTMTLIFPEIVWTCPLMTSKNLAVPLFYGLFPLFFTILVDNFGRNQHETIQLRVLHEKCSCIALRLREEKKPEKEKMMTCGFKN